MTYFQSVPRADGARRCVLATLAAGWLVFATAGADARASVVATYYHSADDPAAIASIPADKVTHLLYAFLTMCGDHPKASVRAAASLASACANRAPFEAVVLNSEIAQAEFDALRQLKKKHAQLVVLPSFGGWSLSHPFHAMARSDAARRTFVRSALAVVAEHDVFDGIDIDWEFPGGRDDTSEPLTGPALEQEKRAFRLLMQELRAGLDLLGSKTGRRYQLTAAVSGASDRVAAIDWRATHPHMDYVFAMTYDFAVTDGEAAHHTNLRASAATGGVGADWMIDNLAAAGVPVGKLVVGVAFYGRAWSNTLMQGGRVAASPDSRSTGTYPYAQLKAAVPPGYEYGYDEAAQAAYLYNPLTGGFISFDDPRSIKAKAQWVKARGCAGLFAWQITQDDGTLVATMRDSLAP